MKQRLSAVFAAAAISVASISQAWAVSAEQAALQGMVMPIKQTLTVTSGGQPVVPTYQEIDTKLAKEGWGIFVSLRPEGYRTRGEWRVHATTGIRTQGKTPLDITLKETKHEDGGIADDRKWEYRIARLEADQSDPNNILVIPVLLQDGKGTTADIGNAGSHYRLDGFTGKNFEPAIALINANDIHVHYPPPEAKGVTLRVAHRDQPETLIKSKKGYTATVHVADGSTKRVRSGRDAGTYSEICFMTEQRGIKGGWGHIIISGTLPSTKGTSLEPKNPFVMSSFPKNGLVWDDPSLPQDMSKILNIQGYDALALRQGYYKISQESQGHLGVPGRIGSHALSIEKQIIIGNFTRPYKIQESQEFPHLSKWISTEGNPVLDTRGTWGHFTIAGDATIYIGATRSSANGPSFTFLGKQNKPATITLKVLNNDLWYNKHMTVSKANRRIHIRSPRTMEAQSTAYNQQELNTAAAIIRAYMMMQTTYMANFNVASAGVRIELQRGDELLVLHDPLNEGAAPYFVENKKIEDPLLLAFP